MEDFMGIFNKIKNKYNERLQVRNEICADLIADINIALHEKNSLFLEEDSFIDVNRADIWENKYSDLYRDIQNIRKLKRSENYSILLGAVAMFHKESDAFKDDIRNHNEAVAKRKLEKAYDLIGDVEGRKLDEQQMMCILKESHNHLVIAGAGTGKTTTIVGKIKYMLRSCRCKPEEILVLSFTNVSAAEMKTRIEKETGEKIMASTFHKLGMSIISRYEGIMPKITKLNMHDFIREQMAVNMKNPFYLKLLADYVDFGKFVIRSEFDFENEKEYQDYLRLNPPKTLNGELVKSYGEMNIANFLKRNGITYEYEKEYEKDTRTEEYGQYYPDFYLTDYGIYIEYFGINRNGKVPPYFSSRHGRNPSEEYNDSIQWKRNTHKENSTKLIECYSYEISEGDLTENLEKKLKQAGVEFKPVPAEKLWEQIVKEENGILGGLVELFETVITLSKNNNYSIENLYNLNARTYRDKGINSFIALVEPVYNAYEEYLKNNNEIDFNDMINKAAGYIKEGGIDSPYRYVIVDEYQDMAKARYNLLKVMRESADYELFCVGDDWQSIYRFAGSDIGLTLNFEQYWGATERSKIETTYRFNNSLIEISGDFIMKNPRQLIKDIKGKSNDYRFALAEINAYKEDIAVDFMVEALDDLPKNSSVFFIGRYSFDSKLLDKNRKLTCEYDVPTGRVKVKYGRRPDLKMEFVSAHKSKGLQADYVFIINNKNSRTGFPSQIQDAPVLKMLLDNNEQFPFAEERRLFYVALTRAKVKTFLLTVSGMESEFVMELREKYGERLKYRKNICPLCGGRLIKHTGIYGDFLGCSNYRKTGCTYKRTLKEHKKELL